MNNNTLIIAFIALLIGGAGGYIIAQNKTTTMMTSSPNNMMLDHRHHINNDTAMHNENMHSGVGMMMVSNEREFITEMIPHHQEAVDTAKEVLARGATTPEIKALMENIIIAQEKEIADMKSWYETWYQTPYQPSGNYTPMMRDLSKLSGKDIDKVFLEDMVMHHMGAIMMAHSVQSYIEHEEIRNLTNDIITTQSEEIQKMRKMRAGL